MSVYEFGPFQLDAARLLLLDRGAALPIGPKVVETLLALIEHPGEVLPKTELLARIWPEGYVDEANLAQNIYVLRKTLRRRWNAEAIETVPRRGYRFTEQVQRYDNVPRPEPASRRPAPSPLRRGWVLAAAFAVALLGGSALTTEAPSATGAASNIAAQDTRLYAMGRYYWNLRTHDGVAKSIGYFSQIVANDSRDARGYAGLALAYAIIGDYNYGPVRMKVAFSRAQAYAHQALVLDPGNGEAYAVLGLIATSGKGGAAPQMVRGLAELRRAIALDPGDGSAHQWYGTALLEQGHVTEAYGELAQAAQLDPLSVATASWLGTTAYLERHYRDAISFARETLDLSPQRADAYETLGLSYEALGDRPRAAQSFQRLAQVCPSCRPESAALLAALYARSSQMVRARSELTIARAHAEDVSPEDLALAFDAVGQREAALAWIRRASYKNDFAATEIANDPRFAALRHSIIALQQKPA
jgi:DNA-binding winged helix-turn-helix (wHTH) protein/tetratricopeptide (TPR) repeat protein